MPNKIAIIGGSNLFNSELVKDMKEERIITPFGTVEVFIDEKTMLIQRHGKKNVPPHAINHKANLYAIKSRDFKKIIAINSVGSLKPYIKPGEVCLVSDFISFYNIITVDADKRIHITPVLSETINQKIENCLGEKFKRVIYWQTTGPRFETPAEIRLMAQYADVVGMTMASECTIACELGLQYASICVVDNYANGISETNIDFDEFNRLVLQNQKTVDKMLKELVKCQF
ncbi:5'-methylthioadenosine phosphorylase [Thermotomaculum hydrothermale]|uniref:5'-methylthioadenosine phosphorylase n=1 Tax=Thermotomaculum hydrothermale TaxID=981385 RepID=A0A7R6PES9_9BACT|nr:MTAP family purine nucleoside phosphorylase [Thermotomaculum hydrothermale]BBB32389.1 5'-methylthioadenosine phosphorylase [Thermotomaculum hydrothermale]